MLDVKDRIRAIISLMFRLLLVLVNHNIIYLHLESTACMMLQHSVSPVFLFNDPKNFIGVLIFPGIFMCMITDTYSLFS